MEQLSVVAVHPFSEYRCCSLRITTSATNATCATSTTLRRHLNPLVPPPFARSFREPFSRQPCVRQPCQSVYRARRQGQAGNAALVGVGARVMFGTTGGHVARHVARHVAGHVEEESEGVHSRGGSVERNDSSSTGPLVKPSLQLSVRQAVLLQMTALAHNDTPRTDHGLEVGAYGGAAVVGMGRLEEGMAMFALFSPPPSIHSCSRFIFPLCHPKELTRRE
ncbi:unnamed protein product [Closterium sp. Naga37s-1]|nr:unnamed protein product [Closterium sp. Naga37s-1]